MRLFSPLYVSWSLGISRLILFLSNTPIAFALADARSTSEMGVYTELPAHLKEVDVIIAGGKLIFLWISYFSLAQVC